MALRHISLTASFLSRQERELRMKLICKRLILKHDSLFVFVLQHFTFIAHALHFVDGLLPILLSQVLGLFHRLAQEFFKLSSE